MAAIIIHGKLLPNTIFDSNYTSEKYKEIKETLFQRIDNGDKIVILNEDFSYRCYHKSPNGTYDFQYFGPQKNITTINRTLSGTLDLGLGIDEDILSIYSLPGENNLYRLDKTIEQQLNGTHNDLTFTPQLKLNPTMEYHEIQEGDTRSLLIALKKPCTVMNPSTLETTPLNTAHGIVSTTQEPETRATPPVSASTTLSLTTAVIQALSGFALVAAAVASFGLIWAGSIGLGIGVFVATAAIASVGLYATGFFNKKPDDRPTDIAVDEFTASMQSAY